MIFVLSIIPGIEKDNLPQIHRLWMI